MRASGLHVNKPAVAVFIGVCLLIVMAYIYLWAPSPAKGHGNSPSEGRVLYNRLPETGAKDKNGGQKEAGKLSSGQQEHQVWSLSQLADPPIPGEDAAKKLVRKSGMVNVYVSGKKYPIYVQQVFSDSESHASKKDVLFLHGAKFSSEDWQKIKALEMVAHWGFHAIAVDLPGRGKSPTALEASVGRDVFMASLVSSLNASRPVIVAPSMSGQYAMPYLFDKPETGRDKTQGFVPVAPVSVKGYASHFPHSQIPTLIVYGSQDRVGLSTLQHLQSLPDSIEAAIPEAGHACYNEQPQAFFKYLHAFLTTKLSKA